MAIRVYFCYFSLALLAYRFRLRLSARSRIYSIKSKCSHRWHHRLCLAWCLSRMTLNYLLGQKHWFEAVLTDLQVVLSFREQIKKVGKLFKKHGAILLLFGYYVAGLKACRSFHCRGYENAVHQIHEYLYFGALAWILIIVFLVKGWVKRYTHIYIFRSSNMGHCRGLYDRSSLVRN